MANKLSLRAYDVEISQDIEPERLRWPAHGEAGEDSGLGGNRLYADLRYLTWKEARHVYSIEGELIGRIENADDPVRECEKIEDDGDLLGELYGLDIGVASTVAALSAVRCIPFSSCNAGAFGGYHREAYPLVAFFARPRMVSLLTDCAKEAQVGIHNGDHGILVVYGSTIRDMRLFAKSLSRRRVGFRVFRAAKRKLAISENQFDLFP